MNGTVVLSISDRKLDFKKIAKEINILPKRIVEKGQKLPLNNVSINDRWIYEKKFDENNYEKILSDFLGEILQYRESLKCFSKINEVALNIYIYSNLGQLGFSLSKESITAINELNIGASFHILSLGEAE